MDKERLIIKFKGRRYDFVETVTVPITDEYVPEWGLYKALRESVQNAYDEAAMAGAEVVPWLHGNEFYIRDTGRGVAFEDILHIGASGKRGVEGVVGQHGEGEVISFLAATRSGFTKWMASQDWLATCEFVQSGGHRILAIHRYVTRKARQGTGWLYRWEAGDHDRATEFEEAWERCRSEFRRHRAVKRKRERVFIPDQAGTLLSNGLEIGQMPNLCLGYDLNATPGRDRTAFTWDQIRDEVAQCLTEHATPEVLEHLLHVGLTYGTYRHEFELLDLVLDPAKVKRAAYLNTRSRSKYRVLWGHQMQAAKLADASEQGFQVLVFHDAAAAPRWVQECFPNVRDAVSGKRAKKSTLKETPRDFGEAVAALLELLGGDPEHPIELHTDLGGDMAHTTGTLIRFHYRSCKQMDVGELLGTLAHELAHDQTGAEDCTRAHTNGVERLLRDAAVKVLVDPDARKLMRRAKVRMDRWAR